MKKTKKNFKTRLDLACGTDESRPVMMNIIFRDGYVVCTNAFILVKQKLELHGFDDEEIEFLNGKSIHRDVFKEIMRYEQVFVEEGVFVCQKGSVKAKFDLECIEGYPNYEAVLPKGQISDLGIFDIDLNYVELDKKVTLSDNGKKVTIRLYGLNKPILLTGAGMELNEELIMVMPLSR